MYVEGLKIGSAADEVFKALKPVLSRKDIFGVDLVEAGLGERVCRYFFDLVDHPGCIRETLHLVANNALWEIKTSI